MCNGQKLIKDLGMEFPTATSKEKSRYCFEIFVRKTK